MTHTGSMSGPQYRRHLREALATEFVSRLRAALEFAVHTSMCPDVQLEVPANLFRVVDIDGEIRALLGTDIGHCMSESETNPGVCRILHISLY